MGSKARDRRRRSAESRPAPDAPRGEAAAARRRTVTTPPVGALWAALVAALTFLVFAPALSFGFVAWDDYHSVYQNPNLVPNVTPSGLVRLWSAPYFELYTPLTSTLWAAVAALSPPLPAPVGVGGVGQTTLDARWFHGAGVAGHALCAALAFLLLRRLVRGDAAAALGALLWALHPLQAEPVAWVTGNNNVFSGLFALAALNLHAAVAAEAPAESSQSPGRRWLRYAGATICYLLALLAKPTAVAVPLLAGAMAVLGLRRPARAVLPALAPWVAVALAWALFTRSSAWDAGVYVPPWQRPLVALDALGFYLGKIALPLSLAVDYGRRPGAVVASWWGWVSAGAALGALAVATWLWRRRGVGWPAAALALLLLGALPVLGLAPFYFQAYSTVADRYLYLALLGPAFAAACLAAGASDRAPRARTAATAALTAVVALLAMRTLLHLPVWRDSAALFSHAVRVNPASAVSHNNLGIALGATGDREGALRHAREATRLEPTNADYLYNLGIAEAAVGGAAASLDAWRRAAEADPAHFLSRYYLGQSLVGMGRHAEAVAPLREATRLKPDATGPPFLLGRALEGQGRAREAAEGYREALRRARDGREAALIAAALGRVEGRP